MPSAVSKGVEDIQKRTNHFSIQGIVNKKSKNKLLILPPYIDLFGHWMLLDWLEQVLRLLGRSKGKPISPVFICVFICGIQSEFMCVSTYIFIRVLIL